MLVAIVDQVVRPLDDAVIWQVGRQPGAADVDADGDVDLLLDATLYLNAKGKFTRSAALELGSSNVNVNAVAPGYIRTTRLTDRVPAEILDRARERSVLGRLGDPQDVASVILFLCSEASRHITGAVIPVDGGYLI